MIRCAALLCVALVACAIVLGSGSPAASAAPGGVGHIDGISDQSLPAWDGSFPTSPFARFFRHFWAGGQSAQIKLARYVVQWDASTQASRGPNPLGDYRERFEAWLEGTRSIGLTPVLALTSYNMDYPRSAGEYQQRLAALLAIAAAMHDPIAYLEAWNEPNGQGKLRASRAAELANAASAICSARHACQVIAGDFEDRSTVARYEREYERELRIHATIWGIHPYVSVRSHGEENLQILKSNLPHAGAGLRIWITEIGVYYCSHGSLRGEARQADEASYLNRLLADPKLAPEHAFYYGFLYANRSAAPCALGGGDDSELYTPADEPRAAASILLGPTAAGGPGFARNSATETATPMQGSDGERVPWEPTLANWDPLMEPTLSSILEKGTGS